MICDILLLKMLSLEEGHDMRFEKTNVLKALKNMFFVVIGTLILSFTTAVFIIPFNLVAGGVSGIAIIIKKIVPWEALTVDLLVTILTWVFFFVGLAVFGKSFALKTLVSTIIYPLGVSLFLRLIDPNVFGGFFYLQGSEYTQVSLILASVFGGTLIGVGCAVSFLGGGSTGGVDIVALILSKIFKKLKSSVAFFIVDATIITLGVFVINNMVLSLLGIVSVLISAVMVDKVFLGGSKAFVAHIVTDKYQELSQTVINKLNRTTTVFDAVGGYSGEKKKIVMVSFTMRQYAELLAVINALDKTAFITIHRAHEINGEGWTR